MRKNIKAVFALAILTTLLSACGEKTMDVQYYLDHPEERKQKLIECRNNPGEKEKMPNCKNAAAAEFKKMMSGTEMPQIK